MKDSGLWLFCRYPNDGSFSSDFGLENSLLGFSGKQRLYGNPNNPFGRTHTMTELAERWRISEATLERWRNDSAGPLLLFLKLGNQVRYRVQDVEPFEEVALRDRP
jgi:hypothetical protein